MEPKIEPQGTFDSIRSAWVMKNIDFEHEVVTLSFREAEWIDTCLRLSEHAPSSPAAPTYPIQLNSEQEKCVQIWASDDRCWTTQETVAFNLRTFARKIIGEIEPPAAPEVTPSPCFANPKMVVKGLCDLDPDSLYLHTKEAYAGACSNWRPTHNVCLNCGKEEKILESTACFLRGNNVG